MAGKAALETRPGSGSHAARRKALTDRILLRELCLAWIECKNHDREVVGLDELTHHLFLRGFPRAPSTVRRRLSQLEEVGEVECPRCGPLGWAPTGPRLDLAWELWEMDQALDSQRRMLAGRVDAEAPVPERTEEQIRYLELDIERRRAQLEDGLPGLYDVLSGWDTPESRREMVQLRILRDRATRLLEECRVFADRWLERLPLSEHAAAAGRLRRHLGRLDALASEGHLAEAIRRLEVIRRAPALAED